MFPSKNTKNYIRDCMANLLGEELAARGFPRFSKSRCAFLGDPNQKECEQAILLEVLRPTASQPWLLELRFSVRCPELESVVDRCDPQAAKAGADRPTLTAYGPQLAPPGLQRRLQSEEDCKEAVQPALAMIDQVGLAFFSQFKNMQRVGEHLLLGPGPQAGMRYILSFDSYASLVVAWLIRSNARESLVPWIQRLRSESNRISPSRQFLGCIAREYPAAGLTAAFVESA